MVHRRSARRPSAQTLGPALTTAAIWLAALWPYTAMAEQDCHPIRFQRGHSAADIAGVAPAGDRSTATEFRCYSLAVGDRQHALIRLVSGRNVAITIPNVGDARDRFEFVTQRGTYELHVFQLFPGGSDEPFRISVKVVD